MTRTLAVAALFLAACKTAPEVGPEAAPPELSYEEVAVASQSLTDATVKYTGRVKAQGERVTVEKALYEFVVDGAVLKSGEKALGVAIEPGTEGEFTMEETFTYVKDLEDLKAMDARGGSILMALRGNFVLKVARPGQGDKPAATETLQLPFAHSREVRTPRLPHVKMLEFEAGRFSESEVQITFHIGVVNPNPFVVSMSSLTYAVTAAGKAVGAGTLGAGDKVSPAGTGIFDVQVTINEETHGKDVKKLIKGLVIPWTVTGTLKAALYEEALDAKGDVKLNPPK